MTARRQFRARVPRGPYDTPEAIERALEALASDMYDLQDTLVALDRAVDGQTTQAGGIRARIRVGAGQVQVLGTLPGAPAITGTDLAITWSPLLVGAQVARAQSVEPGAYTLYWILSHDNARTVLRATDLAGATINLAAGTHALVFEVFALS